MPDDLSMVVKTVKSDVKNKGWKLDDAIAYYVSLYNLSESDLRKALLTV